jgi:hypothetical protein
MEPNAVLEMITASGLAGRGGAGFPTGTKWKAVAEATGEPKSIVCNADEGEPGCFKDRALMDHDPHGMLEGILLAGYACGANRGFVYLRYEYPETYVILGGEGRRFHRGESPRHRVLVPPPPAPRRGSLHLRGGKLAAEQPRGQASISSEQASLSGHPRV